MTGRTALNNRRKSRREAKESCGGTWAEEVFSMEGRSEKYGLTVCDRKRDSRYGEGTAMPAIR